jgi:hypothetical protein
MITFDEFNRLVGFEEIVRAEQRYEPLMRAARGKTAST